MKRAFAALSLIAGVAFLAAPADAAMTLCNKTAKGANVAVGYRDADKGWTAEGWWNVAAGACQTLIETPLSGTYVYLLVDGDRLPPSGNQSGGWFCTDDKGFLARNRDYSNDQHELLCEDAGLKTEQFREIMIRSADLTYNLEK